MIDLYTPPKPAIILPRRRELIGHNREKATTPFCYFVPQLVPPGLTTLTQVSNTSGTGITLAWPSVQAGDIAVWWNWYMFGSVVNGEVTPTGFTRWTGGISNTTIARSVLAYKLCTGSEAGNITGMDPSPDGSAYTTLVIFRGDIPVTTITASTANFTSIDTNPAAQNIAASGQPTPLVVICGYGSSGGVDPRTFSPAKDGEVSPHGRTWQAWKIYNSSPANVSVDMDDEGYANTLASGYLRAA